MFNYLTFTKMTNKMQLCRITYFSLATLHASSDIFAHYQEHLNCIYSFWYYTRMPLPVGIMGELKLLFCSSSRASKLYLQLLVLHTYVAASWYHGRVATAQQYVCAPDDEQNSSFNSPMIPTGSDIRV
jgi:hypothetical protein